MKHHAIMTPFRYDIGMFHFSFDDDDEPRKEPSQPTKKAFYLFQIATSVSML